MELRPYQVEDVDVLVNRKRVLVAHAMGLGKTAIVLTALEKLNAFPALVIATKNALGAWEQEANQWLHKEAAIYSGSPKKRKFAWDEFVGGAKLILITNYAFVEEIAERVSRWPALVADEIHLAGLLNKDTQIFKRFNSTISSEVLYLVTGSPIRKTPADLWAPLHLLYPKQFPSYWQFVGRHCITIKDTFGTSIEPRPKNVIQFRDMLQPYMIRRLKSKDLPPKIRQSIPLEMTPLQERMYVQLAEDLLAQHGNDLIIASSVLTRDTKLRQLLVSPMLLGINDKGAILEALPSWIESEFAEGNSVAIFTPYRRGATLIAEELNKLPKAIRPQYVGVIMGQMKHEAITATTRQFQHLKTHKKVIVCTIRSGTSFTITDASAGYFAGYEWDFNHDEQAEDRMHRIGQDKLVRCYYPMHKNTLDERVMEVISRKKTEADIILLPEHLLPGRYFRK